MFKFWVFHMMNTISETISKLRIKSITLSFKSKSSPHSGASFVIDSVAVSLLINATNESS